MRFMMIMIPNIPSIDEEDWTPSPEAVAAMGKYNEELTKAGVLLTLDGLAPPAKGARVSFAGGRASVTDGPFTEAKEVIGGYWMIEASSREEAVSGPRAAPRRTATRSRFARSSRCRTSRPRSRKPANSARAAQAGGRALASVDAGGGGGEGGGEEEEDRHRAHDRGGVADRGGEADRAAGAAWWATSAWRRSSRRTRSCSRWSSGHSRASRRTRAPG